MDININFGDANRPMILRLKNVQLMPQERPEHTYLFLICTKQKYIDGFLKKGTVKFSKISDWKPDGTSRGDDHECIFATARTTDMVAIRNIAALRKDTEVAYDGNTYYFKSRTAIDMRALCLYGINEKTLQMGNKVSQDHRFHQQGVVPKEYFHDLFPDWNKDRYNSCNGDDKPYLLMIRPDIFYQRVIQGLLSFGVHEDEIFAAPVCYHDTNGPTFIIGHEWDELFIKDQKFKTQSEIRFVIDTRRNDLREALKINDGVIDLGAMEDITTVSEFYFEDMQCEIRDNKLLYSLAVPEYHEISFLDYLTVIAQTLSDELPSSPSNVHDLDESLNKLVKSMQKTFPLSHYDYTNNTVVVQNEDGKNLIYECGSTAKSVLLRHYCEYVQRGDGVGANNTKSIYSHFFGKWPEE